MRNLLFVGYFILKTNYTDLFKSISCTRKKGYSLFFLLGDMIFSSLLYGSSFVDYFNFQFYRKSRVEKKAYATMGIMYDFHNKVNDKKFLKNVDDKKSFYLNFSSFCYRPFLFTKNDLQNILEVLFKKIGNRIVVKNPEESGGKGIQILNISSHDGELFFNKIKVLEYLNSHFRTNDIFYFEDFINQHDLITKISPTAVNTIRMITMIDDHGHPEIIGSVFRISVDSPIDNYSAGNMAAEIDSDTGILISGGIRKRSSCDKYNDIHPVTKEPILGFQIPYWDEIIQMVKSAAMVVPEVRSIGWDVALTNDGPVIIEGNSKWNKDTWQIPAGKGKLHIINKYLKD